MYLSVKTDGSTAASQALEDFERITGDPPDIVSISLNLWDVSWWGHHRSESFDECTIPEADMHNWLQRAMQALKAVQVLLMPHQRCMALLTLYGLTMVHHEPCAE